MKRASQEAAVLDENTPVAEPLGTDKRGGREAPEPLSAQVKDADKAAPAGPGWARGRVGG